MRFYGRFLGTDATYAGEGYGLYPELTAGNGGDRTFVPHHETPLKDQAQGTVEETLYLISLLRLLQPKLLLPATTALGTMGSARQGKGILAGANVVMPNLSPTGVRKQYELYDNKIAPETKQQSVVTVWETVCSR